MTFAGGLPLEAVRTEFESQPPELYHAGVAQEMADLAAIGREAPPQRSGTYAIAGATLIDATGKPPIPDAVVIVRDNRIAAAGPRATTTIPSGMPVIDGKGQTLLPVCGTCTHASGVEFGPAHLAAGITTARDCGGEFDLLFAVRDAIKNDHAIGPRMLLAGLIDAGGPRAFGHVTAETPEEARAAVQRYHAAGFEQIKLYTFTPEIVKVIADEAHSLGMTVTGHVPMAAYNESRHRGRDGLDQPSQLRDEPSARARSERRARSHGLRREAGHSVSARPPYRRRSDVELGRDGEPLEGDPARISRAGDLTAPAIRREVSRHGGQRHGRSAARAHGAEWRGDHGALPRGRADCARLGHGSRRLGAAPRVEIYVDAGMTPLEAIQAATIVPARAMGLDKDSGTVEAGKRADLILVDGDPLKDIRNLRRVARVIADGRVYDAPALWRSAGFKVK